MNVLIYLVLLTTFLSPIRGQCTMNSTCFIGECVQDFCVCASGVTGPLCTEAATSCSALYLNLSATSSDTPPEIDPSFTRLADNTLFVRVFSPLYNNRLSSYLHLRNASAFPQCAFAAWSKRIENCEEVYELALSWSTAADCGWIPGVVSDTETFFDNVVYLTHRDLVTYFRGSPIYRTTVHSFRVSVVLQNVVTLPIGSDSTTSAVLGSQVLSSEEVDAPESRPSYWVYIAGGCVGVVVVAVVVLAVVRRKATKATKAKAPETTALGADLEASLPAADPWVPPARLNLEASLDSPVTSPINSPTPLLKTTAPKPKKKRSPPRERPLPEEMDMPRIELPLSPDMARINDEE